MLWTIANHDAFDPEFDALPEAVQDELLAVTALLETYGPSLGRPHVDTLAGSRHANMKELRFSAADGVWRVAFAFDPKRQAILLVAGDKAGVAQQRFYKGLIRKADGRFTDHLKQLKEV
ncbi:type II toxin-antitoxin system RelE/ParE family toxin [soil metagenome]